MKALIKGSTFVIIFTGLILTEWVLGAEEVAIWVHLLLGFAYTVLFLLFSFDHISGHLTELKKLTIKNITGLTQILAGGITLISGFVLYLYGSQPLEPWTQIHLIATIIFLFSIIAHFFKKGITFNEQPRDNS